MSDAQKFRTMDWLVGVATTVALAISGTALMSLVNISERVAVIESTRFTPEDADKQIQPQLELIVQKLEVLQRDINRIEDGPPQ